MAIRALLIDLRKRHASEAWQSSALILNASGLPRRYAPRKDSDALGFSHDD